MSFPLTAQDVILERHDPGVFRNLEDELALQDDQKRIIGVPPITIPQTELIHPEFQSYDLRDIGLFRTPTVIPN